MKKKIIIISAIFILITLIILLIIKIYKIDIKLNDNLTIQVNDKKYVSDFVVDNRINIINNHEINTQEIGKQKITFKYKYRGITRNGSFHIEIVDTTRPLIMLKNSYTITKGSDKILTDVILCGDNYDANPKCTIEGQYNINEIGSYDLKYKAVDSSNNETIVPFTLNVIEKTNNNYAQTSTNYEDIVNEYKNENTSIGIDISKWQGNIDFKKLKENNVEFVFIRIGVQNGFNGEIIMDPYFEYNIKNAMENDIKIGVYFYSYATTIEESKKQAAWIIENLKNHKIDLPIVFDWEAWSYFNTLDLSFIKLNNLSETFIKTIEDNGYEGMLYGSKNYLESIWETDNKKIWLAHYTSKTTYENDYKVWQICSDGKINGINGYVDIDIMYNK